jgi:hypothetical protein
MTWDEAATRRRCDGATGRGGDDADEPPLRWRVDPFMVDVVRGAVAVGMELAFGACFPSLALCNVLTLV